MSSAKTVFISSALPTTSIEDVRACFEEQNLGVIEKIDTKDYERDDRSLRKFWIHFSSTNTDAFTVEFFKRLSDNDNFQKNGEYEYVTPPRIVYNTRRDGTEMYWHAYYAPTHRAEKTRFKSRIEL